MSRRVVAPILLLFAAACSVAAVFAVHRIETRGGPLSQPSATTFFSPNDDGAQDDARLSFTMREPGRLTVDVVHVGGEDAGARVRRLVDGTELDGEQNIAWDGTDDAGTTVRDGSYRFRIERAGDSRAYSPTKPTVVDTRAPIGILDRATLANGELVGLALLGDGEFLEVFARGELDEPVQGMRQFRPNNSDAQGARPQGPAPAETFPTRFTVSIVGTPERIDVVDKAGNRRSVFPDPTERVQYSAAG